MISLQLLLTKYTSRDQRLIQERNSARDSKTPKIITSEPELHQSVCVLQSFEQAAPTGSSRKQLQILSSKWLNISSEASQELPFAHALITVLKVTTSGGKFQNLVDSYVDSC